MKFSNTQKVLILCASIAAAGTAVYLFIIKPNLKPRSKNKNQNTGKETEVEMPPPEKVYTEPPLQSFPLHKGSKGGDVVSWQQLLAKADAEYAKTSSSIIYDGDFGSRTEAATLRVLGKATVDKADFDKVTSSLGEAAKVNAEQQKANAMWAKAAADFPKSAKGLVLKGDSNQKYTLEYINVNPNGGGWEYTGMKGDFYGGAGFGIGGVWVDTEKNAVFVICYAAKGMLLIPSYYGYTRF